jgi:hypothetical protein
LLKKRSGVKVKLPLLEDKELVLLMLEQMWKDVEREKEKRRNSVLPEVADEKQGSSSPHDSSHGSISISPLSSSPHTPFGSSTPAGRRRSFLQEADSKSFSSSKRIAYFFRSSLNTYFYIGYVILIVLITASFQIYCTNKDNCHNYWGVFVTVQVLLSLDIIVRVLTYYPTYKTFFHSHHNLFDLAMVLIIWIPVISSGYVAQIAQSARIVYLLRLLPLLSWITDLQVIMLSIESSLRPLLYVVGMMFLMFFHFAVAGVLIFKKNDEFYFGSLFRAMMSLAQVCSLDNWGDIALKNMYGCDYYGSETGIEEFDSMCHTPQGLGDDSSSLSLSLFTHLPQDGSLRGTSSSSSPSR